MSEKEKQGGGNGRRFEVLVNDDHNYADGFAAEVGTYRGGSTSPAVLVSDFWRDALDEAKARQGSSTQLRPMSPSTARRLAAALQMAADAVDALTPEVKP